MKDGKNVAVMIGIGAAGSAITECAQTIGLCRGFILNSAPEDLDVISTIDPADKWKLKGINGAAANRKLAQKAFQADYESFLSAVESRLFKNDDGSTNESIDIIFVAASAGGGTGSGIIPAAARLLQKSHPEVQVIPILIWPSKTERGIRQQNCVDCTRELMKDSGAEFPVILVDNTRVDDKMILAKYDRINRETVENIKALLNCDKASRISNIDTADRMSMFRDPGLIVIGSAEVNTKSSNPIIDAVNAAIASTPVTADIAGVTKKVAAQFECDQSLYTSEVKDEIAAMFPNALGFFEGYYAPDEAIGDSDAKNKVLIAFSGARINKQAYSERENLARQMNLEKEATVLGKGNQELKSVWDSGSKGRVSEDSSKASKEDLNSIFDELDD